MSIAQSVEHLPFKERVEGSSLSGHIKSYATVAESADARDLKSLDGYIVWVQVPPVAPYIKCTDAVESVTSITFKVTEKAMTDSLFSVHSIYPLSSVGRALNVPSHNILSILKQKSTVTSPVKREVLGSNPKVGANNLDVIQAARPGSILTFFYF